MTENVSHDTSYSDNSANVENEHEELEESNYDISMFNQQQFQMPFPLTSKLIKFQSLFKAFDFIYFKQNQILKKQHAFDQLKMNLMKDSMESYLEKGTKQNFANKSEFLISGSQANRTSQAQLIQIEDQYRSEQIQNILINSTNQYQAALNPLTPLNTSQIQNYTLQEVQEMVEKKIQQIQDQVPEEQKTLLSSNFYHLKVLLEEYQQKVNHGIQEIQKFKAQLQTKIKQVEEMELDNLEWQLIIDHRLKANEDLRYLRGNKVSVDCQTDLQFQSLSEREQLLEFREKEIEIQNFKVKEELDGREKQIVRRERDLQIREKMIDEQRVEYTYKSKELNQKLKNSMIWPLNCLENEQKLGEKLKDIKLTPDLFKGIQLESDSNFALFLERKENKLFLSELNGNTFMKGENLLKYEYMLLQERTKNLIVKDYTESQLKIIEQEKAEAIRERERYSYLQEMEKSIQEENKLVEESRIQLKKMVESIQGCFKDLDKSQLFSKENTNQIEKSYLNTSKFSEAMQKTQNILKQVFSPTKMTQEDILIPHQNESVTTRIERVIGNFDILNQIQESPSKIEMIEKKEQNLDQIKKILKREAYFIDEEKKWINEKRTQLSKFDKSKISKSAQDSFIMDNSQIKNLFSLDQSENQDEEKKQMKLQQQSLSLEMEKTSQIKDQLNEELRKTKKQNEKLFEIEKQMNEQKLKLLIKLEKIKMLEDFYNVFLFKITYVQSYNQENPVNLEMEVSREEIMRLMKEVQFIEDEREKSQVIKIKSFQERRKIMAKAVYKFLRFLNNRKKLGEDSLQINHFFIWKLIVVQQKNLENELVGQIKQYDNDTIQKVLSLPDFQIDVKPQMIESKSVQAIALSFCPSDAKMREQISFQQPDLFVDQKSWFEALWSRKSDQIQLRRVKSFSSDQLQIAIETFESDIQQFWKFRCTNILKLVDLHMRRRYRLMLAFGFMKYKEQIYRQKIAQFDLELTNQTLFYQNLEEKNLLMEGMPILEATESQGIIQQTPHINRIQGKKGQRGSQFNPQNTDPKVKKQSFGGGLNSKSANILINESQAYSGISEIMIHNKKGKGGKKQLALMKILMRRCNNDDRIKIMKKSQYWNKWRNFMRELEMYSIKVCLKNLMGEIENLKFQEQMLKTNFRVQKTELESKLSLLITGAFIQ